jgi:FixJ family two-component response regulator
MSGYADNTVVNRSILAAGHAFLQKPFAPQQLTKKVREILDLEPEVVFKT